MLMTKFATQEKHMKTNLSIILLFLLAFCVHVDIYFIKLVLDSVYIVSIPLCLTLSLNALISPILISLQNIFSGHILYNMYKPQFICNLLLLSRIIIITLY